MTKNFYNNKEEITNENIKQALQLWTTNKERCIKVYGHPLNWNLNKIEYSSDELLDDLYVRF
uniref:Uncharacterized protein n=1 Tax=viral metagenome TaxID=1070528 RepID=A0A6C0AEZ8_9ZZZZ